MLSGLAFPLGGRWIGQLKCLRNEERLEQGYVLVLPGIEGKSTLNFNISLGLIDGGIPSAIEIHDWTTGFWPFCIYPPRSSRARREAKIIAQKILDYQSDYPNRPTFLVGHSGGAGVVVHVLESLPQDRKVTGAVLLGPAISRSYDLSQALGRTECGIWNFYSPLDLLFLTGCTLLFGTADGRHAVAAGAWGFCTPAHLSPEKLGLYTARLHQVRYRATMASRWHFGGHFGWANRLFVADWLCAGKLKQWPHSASMGKRTG